jgi:hypothetical protein
MNLDQLSHNQLKFLIKDTLVGTGWRLLEEDGMWVNRMWWRDGAEIYLCSPDGLFRIMDLPNEGSVYAWLDLLRHTVGKEKPPLTNEWGPVMP